MSEQDYEPMTFYTQSQNFATKAFICNTQTYYTFFFYKKLGSAPSTKSFLISHENFATIVLKVS